MNMRNADLAAETYARRLRASEVAIARHDMRGAVQELGEAARARPEFPEPWLRLARLARMTGDFDRAAAAYEQARTRGARPEDVFCGLAAVELARGRLDEAQAAAELALDQAPDSETAATTWFVILQYQPGLGAAELAEAARWLRARSETTAPKTPARPTNLGCGRRLRVGYISPDFREHSVLWFIDPLLRAHDREKFEWVGYALGGLRDAWTERVRGRFDLWRDLGGLDDARAAERIAADEVDVLVDLAGRFGAAQPGVFARRPARAQVHYLGFCGRVGISGIDHFISDERIDPAAEESWALAAGERILRVPDGDGFHVYDPQGEFPVSAEAPWRRRDSGVTLGSFNARAKLHEELLALWARLLTAAPKSRLIVRNESFADAPTRRACAEFFAARGLGPERVETRGPLDSRAEHFAAYGEIDIALDAFPYNGVTTTCDALWQGVPVATVRGTRHSGRVTESLLAGAGLAEEWVFDDAETWLIGLSSRIHNPATLPDRPTLARRFRDRQKTRAPELARALETIYRDLAAGA